MYVGYRLAIEPCQQRISVMFNGISIADSDSVLIMHETRLPPVYYFPRDDVRMELLTSTELQTYCPFKGNASYWNLNVAGEVAENAVWSYQQPFDEAILVHDYMAFTWSAMDAWYCDGEKIEQPLAVVDHEPDNPLAKWLLQQGWNSQSSEELLGQFGRALIQHGFPLWRLHVAIRTLHPQLFGKAYSWRAGQEGVDVYTGQYSELQSSGYLNSPMATIFSGEGGIRRRLDQTDVILDYPILHDLKAESATDYVALPMTFSDGRLLAMTLASRKAGGFSLTELGQLHECLPVLSRFFEVHTLRENTETLLGTYLGHDTGKRVLNGEVKRGDGEDIDAVIWFSDLRNSTQLSESLPRAEYLALLNSYFECIAGAVQANGGEVLKFIGDAVLAIFPFRKTATGETCTMVYEQVLAAARDVWQQTIEQKFQYGIAIHQGMITYGNIGSPDRLDFTVIGTAVNETARLQEQCKTLGHTFLVSAAVAQQLPAVLQPLGSYQLRGISKTIELYTLAAEQLEIAA